MRRALIALLLLLVISPARAQRILMPEGYVAFDYPDSCTVLSPQRCHIMAPLLEQRGIDAELLAEEMLREGVLSRAITETGEEAYSVIARADERSRELFDMAEASNADRKRLRAQMEANDLWERTGLRAQDVAWQIEDGRYWLFCHYTVMDASTVLARGLRYTTIYNGLTIALDWRVTGRRFGNRDLTAFRGMLGDLSFLEALDPPMRSVKLAATLPTEALRPEGEIEGTATPGATLRLTLRDAQGEEVMPEEIADGKGNFRLVYALPREGAWRYTIEASAEGMESTTLEGTLQYSESTLPVSGIDEQIHSTSDTFLLTGKTLPGAALQLVSPYGLTKKRTANDGSFSFELTTREVGTYAYTLLIDAKGYKQRRLPFEVVREQTSEQQREAVREKAVRIAYRNLARDLEENRGAILYLTGYVKQASEAETVFYARMYYTKDALGNWSNPVILVSDTPIGAKEGDLLTCAATAEGVDIEQDASGEDVAVPRLRVLFVDKVQ